jgi:SAM-dependent methyltransferase
MSFGTLRGEGTRCQRVPVVPAAPVIRRLCAGPLRALARRVDKKKGRRLAALARFLDPPVDVSEPYTDAITIAVPGWLNRGNLYCFDRALGDLPSDAPMIEIGSFCGLSASLLSYYKRKHGRRNRLITVDIWRYGRMERELGGKTPTTYEEFRAFVKESYLRNVRAFSAWDLPYPFEMSSDELFAAWREGREGHDLFGRPLRLGGPISFCYVDGSHRYEPARNDFRHAHEFLEPGGYLFFDDSYDGAGWGVGRVVAEVRASGDYELVLRNPNYLFRKRPRPDAR